MSVEVKTNIKKPFDWILEDYGEWNILTDYTNLDRYGRLDTIFHHLVDKIDVDDLTDMTDEEMKEVYNREFPLLIAEAFQNIAKDIIEGELIIKTEFE